MFARRLDDCSAISVAEARAGDLLAPGRALICPGNRHLKVRRVPQGIMTVLVDQPPVNGHRPSVDVLFHSVANELGGDSAAVIMTGMGDDGCDGMRAVQASGGVRSLDDIVTLGREVKDKGYRALKTNLLHFHEGAPANVEHLGFEGRASGIHGRNIAAS